MVNQMHPQFLVDSVKALPAIFNFRLDLLCPPCSVSESLGLYPLSSDLFLESFFFFFDFFLLLLRLLEDGLLSSEITIKDLSKCDTCFICENDDYHQRLPFFCVVFCDLFLDFYYEYLMPANQAFFLSWPVLL